LEQKGLARLLRSPARASEVLRKKRHLTIEMVRRLHREWQIPLESLVAPYTLTRPKSASRSAPQRRR
jgi:HTH-type transcriptional regulator/antitoxin HigA